MDEKVKKKDYVRYGEGAEIYSMSRCSFMKLAKDANAIIKINRISIVDTRIFETYLESFRL